MSGIKDGVGVQDGAATGLRISTSETASLQRNLEGKRVGFNITSTDDSVGRNHLVVTILEYFQWKPGQDQILGCSYLDIHENKIEINC